MKQIILTILLLLLAGGIGWWLQTNYLPQENHSRFLEIVATDFHNTTDLPHKVNSYSFPLPLEGWSTATKNLDTLDKHLQLDDQLQLAQDFIESGQPLANTQSAKTIVPSPTTTPEIEIHQELQAYYGRMSQFSILLQELTPPLEELSLRLAYWFELQTILQNTPPPPDPQNDEDNPDNTPTLEWLEDMITHYDQNLPPLAKETTHIQNISMPDSLTHQQQALSQALQSYLDYQQELQTFYQKEWELLALADLEEITQQELTQRQNLQQTWDQIDWSAAQKESLQLKNLIRDLKDDLQTRQQAIEKLL